MGTWNKKSWLIYIASTTLIPNSREKPGSHFILRKIENNSRLIISWSHLNWPSPGQIGNSTSRWRKKMEEWNPLLSLEETEDGETTKETSITWCTKTEDLTRFPLSQMRIVPFFLGGGGWSGRGDDNESTVHVLLKEQKNMTFYVIFTQSSSSRGREN